MMIVRRATLTDVATLSKFGRRVFEQTFAPDNRPDDLRTYLDQTYTETRQHGELTDPGVITLLLECDRALAAFAQLRDTTPPDGVSGEAPIELRRFYVDFPWHGRGVAQTLMSAVEDAARARVAHTLWLGVWERNERAQAFYRKQGFTVVGSHMFLLGTDPQRDLIMAKGL